MYSRIPRGHEGGETMASPPLETTLDTISSQLVWIALNFYAALESLPSSIMHVEALSDNMHSNAIGKR
jgi:hypothetical protein